VLLFVSCLFPIAASVVEAADVPRWVGVADVVVAAFVVVSGMVIMAKKPGDFAPSIVALTFKVYRGLAHAALLLLVVFFVTGDGIRWSILLPGLAWRGWLLTTVLPSWLSLWTTDERRVV
jgi:hypothetical protein